MRLKFLPQSLISRPLILVVHNPVRLGTLVVEQQRDIPGAFQCLEKHQELIDKLISNPGVPAESQLDFAHVSTVVHLLKEELYVIDLDGAAIHVYRRLAEHKNGEIEAGPTKSVAGARTVALPDVLVTELRGHIAEYAEEGTEGLVFTGDRDGPLRRGNFHRATAWTRTVVAAGLPSGFHFHDLRHTGNHLAATAGASTRELMHRMGHGSMRAALIYQHATSERDRAIARRLNDLVQRDEHDDG